MVEPLLSSRLRGAWSCNCTEHVIVALFRALAYGLHVHRSVQGVYIIYSFYVQPVPCVRLYAWAASLSPHADF